MRKITKIGLILGLVVLISFTTFYYLWCDFHFESDSVEIIVSRMYALLSFNLMFFTLFFVINLKHYLYVFVVIVIFGTSLWILEYVNQFLEVRQWIYSIDGFIEVMLFMTFNVVAPGLVFVAFYYIKKISYKYKGANISKTLHLHEGFFGIVLFAIALVLLLFRSFMVPNRVFWRQLRLVLAIVVVFAFLLIFFGSFLILRDWRDVMKFKFIEKVKDTDNGDTGYHENNIFNQISKEDLKFFKKVKVLLYPIGMFLTSFSFNMIAYGTYFLPEEIFRLNYENIVLSGYILSFIAGGLIGLDWFRIFKHFYPDDYEQIILIINKLERS